MIAFDYTNMMQDSVGAEQGVATADLEVFADKAKGFHRDIMQRRERGELPFFDLPGNTEIVEEVFELAEYIKRNFDSVVVLGIGGSALGTTAVFNALCPQHNLKEKDERDGLPRLFVLDNVDPDGFSEQLKLCKPERTCFLVISKSGTTVETTSQFLVARAWVETAAGEKFREHFILITDPEKGVLRELAEAEGYRSCSIPDGVGGRFSVFTPVGLLPLAAAGVDIKALLKGAGEFARFVCHDDLMSNPAYLNATLQYLAYQKGQVISVLMPYSDRLRDIADWFRQLWAESLGKKFALDGSEVNVGPTPVNALGTTDQHSQVQLYMEGPYDKVVTFIVVDNFASDLKFPGYPAAPKMAYLENHSMGELIKAEQQATAAALTRNQRVNCAFHVNEVNAETVGALIYLFEVQTLYAGYLFNVDPLDQPGVEEGKQLTYALMGRAGYEGKASEFLSIKAKNTQRVVRFE